MVSDCYVTGSISGDWDEDDLLVFVEQWMRPGDYWADIAPSPDGDGIVNMFDFGAQAENWEEK